MIITLLPRPRRPALRSQCYLRIDSTTDLQNSTGKRTRDSFPAICSDGTTQGDARSSEQVAYQLLPRCYFSRRGNSLLCRPTSSVPSTAVSFYWKEPVIEPFILETTGGCESRTRSSKASHIRRPLTAASVSFIIIARCSEHIEDYVAYLDFIELRQQHFVVAPAEKNGMS